MPAWVLPFAGCRTSFEAVPVATLKLAEPLVSPDAEAVMVALPSDVAVKLEFATPLVGDTGDAGLHDPETPLAENVTGLVALVTVLPN